jgi:hypothetical protein
MERRAVELLGMAATANAVLRAERRQVIAFGPTTAVRATDAPDCRR